MMVTTGEHIIVLAAQAPHPVIQTCHVAGSERLFGLCFFNDGYLVADTIMGRLFALKDA